MVQRPFDSAPGKMTFQLQPTEPQGEGALEHWPTPVWVTEALLQQHPPPTDWVVEPSAGEGGIAEVLVRHGHRVLAYEVRQECGTALSALLKSGHVVFMGDWLLQTPDDWRIGSYSVVMNPPYRPAATGIAHVAHALASKAVYVAALLPLSWLSGSEARRRFYTDYGAPSHLYGFTERPRFSGAGGQFEAAWFVWDRSRAFRFDQSGRLGAVGLLGRR